MTRKNCKQPDACVAGSRGPCRLCSDMTAHAERMRKLHADPEFAAAHAERSAERMRKLNAEKLHALGVPVGAENIFRLARKKGFSKKEAARIARDATHSTREAAE